MADKTETGSCFIALCPQIYRYVNHGGTGDIQFCSLFATGIAMFQHLSWVGNFFTVVYPCGAGHSGDGIYIGTSRNVHRCINGTYRRSRRVSLSVCRPGISTSV
jgi:hypothetical protein